jgi:peptide-methionine (S)-S-oxide reductase
MKQRYIAIMSALLVALAIPTPPAQAETTDTVVLAGGCFWGVQAVFNAVKGVTHTEAGYSGGIAATAHYEIVSTGTTGHAESVEVTFDPKVVSFKQLLEVYFNVAHDPTQLDRQDPDQGSQYRSEIYYTNDSQRAQAQAYIAELEHRHAFNAPIVTKLEPLHGFYPAEAYHQEFLVHNPTYEYIVYNDIPKVQALRRQYPTLVNPARPEYKTLFASR